MITKIKEALNCKNDSELARLLNINRSRISYWKNKGFHKSTESLLKLLLEEIENGKIKS